MNSSNALDPQSPLARAIYDLGIVSTVVFALICHISSTNSLGVSSAGKLRIFSGVSMAFRAAGLPTSKGLPERRQQVRIAGAALPGGHRPAARSDRYGQCLESRNWA